MKVAIVCDWLNNVGGAEKVLLRVHRLFPEAPIYTSQYDPKGIDWFSDAEVRTGWMQKYPTCLRRILGPLRQRYFSKLDLSEYDLIISVTGAEAKAVRSGSRLAKEGKPSKNPRGIHVSYCHVPTQYYWGMYDEYMKNPGFGMLNPLVRLVFRMLVGPLRRGDLKAAQRPDYYVTISEYAKEAISKYYGRDSVVVHPPVEVKEFTVTGRTNNAKEARRPSSVSRSRGSSRSSSRGSDPLYLGSSLRAPFDITAWSSSDYYITTSRQVNWKRLDLAVKACMMTQRKLIVIGEGPEHKKLVRMASGSGLVEFLPLMDKKELVSYLAQAKGYLFPSLEPFGIAPVEALAAGCPVIAYKDGGSRDYIEEGKNGLLFSKQTAKSLAEAILKYEKMSFNRERVAKTAMKFNEERFDKELKDFIKKCEKKSSGKKTK